MPCERCNDGDGICVFPYYGVAPHKHEGVEPGKPRSWLGSTHILPRTEWPDNFREGADGPGLGTYTHCPYCGEGESPTTPPAGAGERP